MSIHALGADGYYYVATPINAFRLTSSGYVTANAGKTRACEVACGIGVYVTWKVRSESAMCMP